MLGTAHFGIRRHFTHRSGDELYRGVGVGSAAVQLAKHFGARACRLQPDSSFSFGTNHDSLCLRGTQGA